MKILIIDSDPVASELLKTKMRSQGCEVVAHTIKQDGIEELSKQSFDCIFYDPKPMKDHSLLVMDIQRHSQNQPYIVIMSEDLINDERREKNSNFNVFLQKPINNEILKTTLDNASRFQQFSDHMKNLDIDFPSAGGVISKSAFCQLFLSAIDRSGRYGEDNSLIVVTIDNHEDIIDLDGSYAADYAIARLSRFLANIRRQSDIIGQIAPNQFALLLQRPLSLQEPIDAARRFADNLQNHDLITEENIGPVILKLELMGIPDGSIKSNYEIIYNRNTN